MLEILSAHYDNLDVTEEIKLMVENNKLKVVASNDIFGDPTIGKVKKLTISYKLEDDIKSTFAYEGYSINIPENNLDANKILLLTSCNRIKQVILALTINSYIIKNPFHLIIADSSTPDISNLDGSNMHNMEPYNHINKSNYCSDISLFEKYIKLLPNIISYKIIHVSPRLEKAQGDAVLITLGLTQASLIGSISTKDNYCIKLSGVAIMKDDLLSNLDEVLKHKDALTFHRSGFGHGEYSTRVFGCRPEIVSCITQKSGWINWVNAQAGDTEFRLAEILNNNIPDRILYTQKDESCLLDNGGCHKDELRRRIEQQIIKNKIPSNNPIIKEFIDGGIW